VELTAALPTDTERRTKVTVDHAAVDRLFVALFVQAHATPPVQEQASATTRTAGHAQEAHA
jgi:hypothetical protein